jgi:hypothetical protein
MLSSIKILHLEPTDVCQAECPLCPRETDSTFNKSIKNNITVDTIIHALSPTIIQNLDKMYMCGNYGDPAAGKHTLELYEYFRKVNPNISLGMNTNGAINGKYWWLKLAKILNQPRDYVVFSIDGLEDTNHIYRKNVNWKRLILNATSFIESGGNAHWDMLIYKHNEHQVKQCEQLARDMGFKWFRAKVSKRPLVGDLLYPMNHIPINANGAIKCQALQENSIFMDSTGKISPCCWLGMKENISLEEVASTWNTNAPHPTCKMNCSLVGNQNKFNDQWKYEVEF